MNKIIKLFLIFIVCLISIFLYSSVYAKAEEEIIINTDKEVAQKGEEFSITIANNSNNIAACTIWLYFDTDKVEFISNLSSENSNLVDNKIIYTWFSETGKNTKLGEFAEFKFRGKSDGIASFSVVGELYNQDGEKLEMSSKQIEVDIGNVQENEKSSDISEIQNYSNDKSDSNLEIMRLNQEGIRPDFDKTIKEYYLLLDTSIKNLDITAIPSNENAKVSISGDKNLKNGSNIVKISVTSENGENTSDYIINVTKTDNKDDANANLENLAVENYNLVPEFNANTTNYNVEISKDTNSLNILAIPENFNSKVTVEGNVNLKTGSNLITINVTAVDGITTTKYYISVYKRNDEEEAKYKEEQEKMAKQVQEITNNQNMENEIDSSEYANLDEIQKENTANRNDETLNKIFIIVGIVLAVIVIGIVIIRIKKKD